MDYSTGARGSGPVQFERQAEEDPFGLDQHVSNVRAKRNALDGIGTRGSLSKRYKPRRRRVAMLHGPLLYPNL